MASTNNIIQLFPNKKNAKLTLIVDNEATREKLHTKAKQLAIGVFLLLENDLYDFSKRPDCEKDLLLVVESINSLLLKYNKFQFPVQEYAEEAILITNEITRDYVVGEFIVIDHELIKDDNDDGPEVA